MQNIGHYEAVCAEVIRLLREERERKQLSRYAISKSSGISQSMLSLVERNLRNPTMELVLRIADEIGADLPKLIKQANATVKDGAAPQKSSVKASRKKAQVKPKT